MASRLREKYVNETIPALVQEFNFTTPMQAPRLTKAVLNIGLGEAVQNAKALDAAVGDLTAIAGQKPVVTRAKKAVASFKLRQGMPIGAMVTLRGDEMYDFLDRLINMALPRIRDFRGVTRKSFDGRGNYSLGLREQIMFPEIDYDRVDKIRGLEVAIVTTATDDAQGYALLKRLGMPFND
ncbi:MAG: 50S ribosomal protein L5 [Chloroflexales bacterium]|nr:50S ribosomal protein L5 [Chloroflexales bacterium]